MQVAAGRDGMSARCLETDLDNAVAGTGCFLARKLMGISHLFLKRLRQPIVLTLSFNMHLLTLALSLALKFPIRIYYLGYPHVAL